MQSASQQAPNVTFPQSYEQAVRGVTLATQACLKDGKKLLEVRAFLLYIIQHHHPQVYHINMAHSANHRLNSRQVAWTRCKVGTAMSQAQLCM